MLQQISGWTAEEQPWSSKPAVTKDFKFSVQPLNLTICTRPVVAEEFVMEFIKRNWFYLLAALVLCLVFYQISQLPTGIISTAPPSGSDTSFKTYNNEVVPANEIDLVKKQAPATATATPVPTPTVETTTPASESGVVALNAGDTKTVATGAGKPVEIIIKDSRTRAGNDEENDLGHDPRTLQSFFNTGLSIVEYIAKLAFYALVISFVLMLMAGQISWRNLFGGARSGGQGRFAPNEGGSAQATADKSFGQWVEPETIKINGFDDVAGVPEAISQFRKLRRQIIEQADAVKKIRKEEEDAKKAAAKDGGKSIVVTAAELMAKLQTAAPKSKFGGKLPQCVLLEGPPGTGKTLLITALAKECGVPVFVISGSDFVEMFVGLGANRVREMFSDARDKRPCIIFIDEIDAVGRARSGGPGSHPEADQTLNQMLVELQGLNTGNQNFGLWILAATNRVDILDKALLRPGRFTWKIKVDPPHLEGRVAILNVHTKKREVPLASNVDFTSIASVLAGLTGADLENVVNETALYAEELAEAEAEKLRSKGVAAEEIASTVKSTVSQEDFFEGLLRHLMGLKTEINLTFDEIFNTVVHEAGHAIGIAYEGYLGRTAEIVRFIAVEPRGRTGGLTFKTPSRDVFGKTLTEVDADAVCGFGGSAAQLVFLNVKDSGPDNDFEVVAQHIYRAIGRWYGSEKLGPISLGQRGMTATTEMGSAQKDLIDAECNLKTKVLYARTWWIMNQFIRSETVWTMFWELLEGKIMRQDRFADLFAAAMKEVQAHPTWDNGSLDELLAKVTKDPYSWAPEPLDFATRTYLDNRIEVLRVRYEALSVAKTAE